MCAKSEWRFCVLCERVEYRVNAARVLGVFFSGGICGGRNICRHFSRATVRMTRRKMCVKPMEENEEDKVVSMIINYFTVRVNMRREMRRIGFRVNDDGGDRAPLGELFDFSFD